MVMVMVMMMVVMDGADAMISQHQHIIIMMMIWARDMMIWVNIFHIYAYCTYDVSQSRSSSSHTWADAMIDASC